MNGLLVVLLVVPAIFLVALVVVLAYKEKKPLTWEELREIPDGDVSTRQHMIRSSIIKLSESSDAFPAFEIAENGNLIWSNEEFEIQLEGVERGVWLTLLTHTPEAKLHILGIDLVHPPWDYRISDSVFAARPNRLDADGLAKVFYERVVSCLELSPNSVIQEMQSALISGKAERL